MTMTKKDTPDTSDEVAELAAAEAWLDRLDPAAVAAPEADASDLRRIGQAAAAIETARGELAAAVAAARANGRSWGAIGMVLGVTKQAARERFSSSAVPSQRSHAPTLTSEAARERPPA